MIIPGLDKALSNRYYLWQNILNIKVGEVSVESSISTSNLLEPQRMPDA